MLRFESHMIDDTWEMLTESYACMCRGDNPNAFIRIRKFPLSDVLYSILNSQGQSLDLELRDYMKTAHPGESISKAAYHNQREKLNPAAIEYLYKFHNKNFYADPETYRKTLKGYYLFGVDVTDIKIPATPENLDIYGDNGCEAKKECHIKMSAVYDLLNQMIVDASCNPYRFDPIETGFNQVMNIPANIGTDVPYISIYDRGYGSVPLFMKLDDAGKKFVVRIKVNEFLKEELQSLKTDDEDITIKITQNRRANHLGTNDEAIMYSRDSFTIRVVRVWVPNNEDGPYSLYITNLSREEFPQEIFYDLYHLRWGIETEFQLLKDRLQLENVTGTKNAIILQDIYAKLYISNLMEDMAGEVEHKQKEHLENDYKYPHKINRSYAIGVLKDDLIYALLTTDPNEKIRVMNGIYEDISKKHNPVRKGRNPKRNNPKYSTRHSNTHKNCF